MQKKLKQQNNSLGFTLLEILLSIALIAAIAGIGTPIYLSLQTRNDLDVTATTIAQSVRRSQILAESGEGDDSWGVRIEADEIILFKGTSYSSRDEDFDESFPIAGSIEPSGLSEIVFDKFTGTPSTDGTITLTSTNNETRDISIYEKGLVEY